MGERCRIYNLLGKMNDQDRAELTTLLVKAGYAARIGREREGNKGAYTYFVEFWKEVDPDGKGKS